MKNQRSVLAFFLGAAFLLATLPATSGCRFKSPTIAEQKYLMEKGAFPGGVPSWVATPTGAGRLGGGGIFSGGLIPQTFTATTLDPTKGALPSADRASGPGGSYSTPQAIKKEIAPTVEEPDSPLHRIAKLCPSVESEVSANLTNLDVKQRIRAYESLTTRCPASADLWLWLGKDYTKDGQHVKAGRSFERVLVIDASNKEAQDLLAENREQLNSRGKGQQGKKSSASEQPVE